MIEVDEDIQPNNRAVELSGSKIFLHFYSTKCYHKRYILNNYNNIPYYSFYVGDLTQITNIKKYHSKSYKKDEDAIQYTLYDKNFLIYYADLKLPKQFQIMSENLLILLNNLCRKLNELIGYDMENPKQSKTNINFNYAIYSDSIVLLLEAPSIDVENEELFVDDDILKRLCEHSAGQVNIMTKDQHDKLHKKSYQEILKEKLKNMK